MSSEKLCGETWKLLGAASFILAVSLEELPQKDPTSVFVNRLNGWINKILNEDALIEFL